MMIHKPINSVVLEDSWQCGICKTRYLLILATTLAIFSTTASASTLAPPVVAAPLGLQWSSTFSDNFSSASSLDGWTYDLGNNNGWG